MKQLNWKHGNLHENVKKWKEKLQAIQLDVDKDPHNAKLKEEEADILKKYKCAIQDEEKLLFQQAKIEWLSDGDRNSKFFHAVVKGRSHKNKIQTICNEQGDRVEGNAVAEQF